VTRFDSMFATDMRCQLFHYTVTPSWRVTTQFVEGRSFSCIGVLMCVWMPLHPSVANSF